MHLFCISFCMYVVCVYVLCLVCLCVCVYMSLLVCLLISVCMHARLSSVLYVVRCVFLYVCIYACIRVCLCIYLYTVHTVLIDLSTHLPMHTNLLVCAHRHVSMYLCMLFDSNVRVWLYPLIHVCLLYVAYRCESPDLYVLVGMVLVVHTDPVVCVCVHAFLDGCFSAATKSHRDEGGRWWDDHYLFVTSSDFRSHTFPIIHPP